MGWLPNSPIKSLFCGVWLEVAALCETETVYVHFFKGSPLWLLQKKIKKIMIVQAYLCRLLCILHIQLIFNGCIKYLVPLIDVRAADACIQEWSKDYTKSWRSELLSANNLTWRVQPIHSASVWDVDNEKNEYWLSFPPWNIFIYLKFVLIWILVTQFSYTLGCFSRDLMGKPLLMSKLTQHCDVGKQTLQAHLNQMAACLKLFSP